MLRWDGTQWTQEPSDNPGPNNYPLAVECRTSEDCFSVGAYQPPAVLLWTMTWQRHESGWNAVPAENQGNNWNVLHATWPVGANFAWAVGRYQIGPTNQSQIEKWDGQAWHIFPSPNPSTSNNALRGVSVVPGSCESWAVGYYVNTVVGYSQTLIERYTPAPGCTP